jgi:uncharacterized protein (DUF58 family)
MVWQTIILLQLKNEQVFILKTFFLWLNHFFRSLTYRLLHFNLRGCGIKIKPRNPYLIVLFFLLLVYFLISAGQVVMMLLAGLLGMILCAYFWARQMATCVIVTRQLHYRAFQVGDELEELIHIHNLSIFPILWGEFADGSDIPGYSLTGVQSVAGAARSDIRLRTLCKRRGVYHLGPWKFITGDPLGFFMVEFEHPESEEILVYPPLTPLPPQILAHRFTLGDKRSLRQPVTAETINAFTTRNYLPGDPLRRIHWPTTARRDSLYVRVFDPESSSAIWLVPDFNSANHLGEGDDASVEKMVILTASLADTLLKQKVGVGLAADVDGLKISSPRQGKASLWPLLKVLSPLQISKQSSLTQVIGRLRSLISDRDLIMVITPSLDVDWVNQLKLTAGAALINRLQVIILDPHSFDASLPQSTFTNWRIQTGIPALLIKKEEIQPVEGVFGATSRWDFKVTGTGRVIAQHAPKVADSYREEA